METTEGIPTEKISTQPKPHGRSRVRDIINRYNAVAEQEFTKPVSSAAQIKQLSVSKSVVSSSNTNACVGARMTSTSHSSLFDNLPDGSHSTDNMELDASMDHNQEIKKHLNGEAPIHCNDSLPRAHSKLRIAHLESAQPDKEEEVSNATYNSKTTIVKTLWGVRIIIDIYVSQGTNTDLSMMPRRMQTDLQKKTASTELNEF